MSVDLNEYYLDSDFHLPIPMSQTKLDRTHEEEKTELEEVTYVGEDGEQLKARYLIYSIVLTEFNLCINLLYNCVLRT